MSSTIIKTLLQNILVLEPSSKQSRMTYFELHIFILLKIFDIAQKRGTCNVRQCYRIFTGRKDV